MSSNFVQKQFDYNKTKREMNKIKWIRFIFCLKLSMILSSCSSQPNQNMQNHATILERINNEKTTDMKKEEKKIRKVFTDYVVFWNNHEIDKWGVLFTEDTKFITWSGGRYDSNKANIESHKKAHKFLQESKQNMTYQLDDISMEFLHDDIALVYATWIWTDFKTDDNVEDRSGYLTMVLVKSDDRWLIKTTQNTRIDKVLG